MSVLVSNRRESRFEVIVFSLELHQMLIEFMQRDFGVRDLDQLVRVRYAKGKTRQKISQDIVTLCNDLRTGWIRKLH